MSTLWVDYPSNGSGIPTYPNLASFPSSAADGSLALALDTDNLYAFNLGTSTWVEIGGPGAALALGNLDAQAASAKGASLTLGTLSMQSADATHPGLVNTTTQSFGGNKTFTGTIAASNLSGTNTGNVTLTAVGSSPSANGASLSGQALTLQPADATHPGLVNTSSQAFGGTKTFDKVNSTSTYQIGASDVLGFSGTNFYVGAPASGVITSGAGNMFVGPSTGPAITSGTDNTAFGNSAGNQISTGGENTLIGRLAGFNITSGNDNTLIGWSAGQYIVSGIQNTLVGSNAGFSGLTGSTNTGVGHAVFFNATAASQNTTVGKYGLVLLSTGGDNSTLGFQAGFTVTSGQQNTLLGSGADVATGTFNNAIAIGYNVVAGATNAAVIGNSSSKVGLAGITSPSARLHLPAGSTTIAPLIINSGTNLTSAVSGAIEYDGTNLYFTDSNPTRRQLAVAGSYITALTGDVSASGPGSAAATLTATSNATLTTLSGLTTASSLASVGTITSGTWSGTTIALNKGGTGQTTKAAAFDALSPMTTGGDLIYGGASGTGTRLANGSAGQFLKSNGTTLAPSWAAFGFAISNKTVAYTTTNADNVLTFDMSGSGNANYAVTLVTAVGNSGLIQTLNVIVGTGILSVNTTSAQTVGGFASGDIKLATVNDSIAVISDGTNWQIIENNISVSARYTNTAGTSTSSSEVVLDFATKDYDPLSLVTTGASWVFTVPYAGKYLVQAFVNYQINTYTTNQYSSFSLFNGATRKAQDQDAYTGVNYACQRVSTVLQCAKNDTLQMQIRNDGGASLATSAGMNAISIMRIGN